MGESAGKNSCWKLQLIIFLSSVLFTGNWTCGFVLKTLSLEAPARIKNKTPPLDWPQEGEVVFENAEMRYRENLPLVLKKVSFTIKPKEKIGIVGRTGSGKEKH